MVRSNTVDQLETLNELFSQICRIDPELTENAKKAIRFFSKESEVNNAESTLKMGVQSLIDLYFGDSFQRVCGVEYWHISTDEYLGTLWLRESIKKRLLSLSGYPKSVFLITGLRAVILRKHRYWSKSCEHEFRELKSWIESLTLARVPKNQNLSVLIL